MLLQAHRRPPSESHDTDNEDVEIMEPRNIHIFFGWTKPSDLNKKTAQGLQRGEQKLMRWAGRKKYFSSVNDDCRTKWRGKRSSPPKIASSLFAMCFSFGPDMIS